MRTDRDSETSSEWQLKFRHTEQSEVSQTGVLSFTPHPNLLPKEKGLAAFPLQGTLAEPTKRSWVVWNCVPYGWGIKGEEVNLTHQLEMLKQVQYD